MSREFWIPPPLPSRRCHSDPRVSLWRSPRRRFCAPWASPERRNLLFPSYGCAQAPCPWFWYRSRSPFFSVTSELPNSQLFCFQVITTVGGDMPWSKMSVKLPIQSTAGGRQFRYALALAGQNTVHGGRSRYVFRFRFSSGYAAASSFSRALPLRNQGRSRLCIYRGRVRFFANSLLAHSRASSRRFAVFRKLA